MNRNDLEVLGSALLLGATAGPRGISAIAATARARAESGAMIEDAVPLGAIGPRIVRRARRRIDRKVASLATIAAMLEILLDRTPRSSRRTSFGPLAGGAVAGAIVGASIAQMTGRDRATLAGGGALAALAGAHISARVRRSLEGFMPPLAAAIIEDTIVLAVALGGSRLLVDATTANALPALRPGQRRLSARVPVRGVANRTVLAP